MAFFLAVLAGWIRAAPAPELPGVDVRTLFLPTADSVRKQAVQPVVSDHGEGWEAPPLHEQLGRDPMLLGPVEGAVFVPVMTEAEREPMVLLRGPDGQVSTSRAGRRVLVEPGRWTVELGSGPDELRLTREVEVRPGRTEVVPVDWSGLTIEVINSRRQRLRSRYTVLREDGFRSVGEGYGRSEDDVEGLETWILQPGLYRLTGIGGGAGDVANFVTVRLMPGVRSLVTLVMDEGQVVAGGEVSATNEMARVAGWNFGLDLAFNLDWSRERTSTRTGIRQSTSVSGLTGFRVRRDGDQWRHGLDVNYLGGVNRIPGRPLHALPEELRARWQSVWKWLPRVGPYLRVTGVTNLFPQVLDLGEAADPMSVWHLGLPDSSMTRVQARGVLFELTPALRPWELRQGAGLRLDLASGERIETILQVGLAARQRRAAGTLVQVPVRGALAERARLVDPDGYDRGLAVVKDASDESGVGLEADLEILARLPLSITWSATPGLFWNLYPGRRMEVGAQSVLSLHLTRRASIDYRADIRRTLEADAVNRWPYTHRILVRFGLVI